MWWSGRPARHMVVIGVTGTDGKTTTATLIAELLRAGGYKVGLSSSVFFQIGDRRWLNESHMTMPGRFGLQSLLREMVQAKCDFAVLEVSSEGIRQHRHIGIDFDAAVLTNLTPEHIEAHGGFDEYRKAKGRLFERLIKSGDKQRAGKHVKRISVVNLDDPSADYFLKFWAEEHHGVTLKVAPELPGGLKYPITTWSATQIESQSNTSEFTLDGHRVKLGLPGRYNVANAAEAIAVARACGVEWNVIEEELAKPRTIPGRSEVIQGKGFRVVVDYALTPAALRAFYQSLRDGGAKRIIAVFGAAGGGRDRWKRPQLGAIAGEFAHRIILTTDDPYQEDPHVIAGEIAGGIPAASTAEVETILDRRAAIEHAIKLAEPEDVIAVTGMGAETSMMIQDKRIAWSDAGVVRELLAKRV